MTVFITDLARIESPSSEPRALQEILTWLQRQFTALGLYTIRIPGKTSGGYLYARPKKRYPHQPVQLLIGHCDTVWPLHTLREMPLLKTDGQLSGPGVYDMKAGIAQIFFALRCLEDCRADRIRAQLLCPVEGIDLVALGASLLLRPRHDDPGNVGPE